MTTDRSIRPRFEPAPERPGVTVVDPVETHRVPLTTSAPVSPTGATTDGFAVPVDSAATIRTEQLELPFVVKTCVREPSGELLSKTDHYAMEQLPAREYLLELLGPVKIYALVDGAVSIAPTDDHLLLSFEEPTTVTLGALSAHERPAATVTTTGEPRTLARAVSTFGSALKTLSCERSIPSLRGHPPRLELGDRLDVPEGIESPDTGVRLVVPPTREAVMASASLSYYLGAAVVTGSEPRIETDDGLEYALGEASASVRSRMERVLEHVFFFDAVTRIDGLYPVDLRARRRVDERVDLDLESLYDAPLGAQLAAYLSVPFEAVADLRPTWQLATYVDPRPAHLPALPFLADDLSHVRTPPESGAWTTEPAVPDALEAFTRDGRDTHDARGDVVTRSADDETFGPRSVDRRGKRGSDGDRRSRPDDWHPETRTGEAYVSPPRTETFETAWLGDGIPTRGNDLLLEGFENGFAQSPTDDSIDVTVVCTDPRMAAEYDGADGLYGDRQELPFEIDVHREPSVDELRSLLASETTLLHYVGHVEDDRLVCRDGHLDPRELDAVGVETFLLNGCRSYGVGRRLVEAGSLGGVVTLSEVENENAIAVGRTIGRLLNAGFTLRSAVELTRDRRFVGNQYVVVGDGGAAVAQPGSVMPNRCQLERLAPDRYELRLEVYHSHFGQGAFYMPYLDAVDRHFLAGTELPPIELSTHELARFFALEEIPVDYDGTLHWSSEDRFAVD